MTELLEERVRRLESQITEMRKLSAGWDKPVVVGQNNLSDHWDTPVVVDEKYKTGRIMTTADTAKQWIEDCPPKDAELTTNYYMRYTINNWPRVHDNQFEEFVEAAGYKIVRAWRHKNWQGV